MRWGGQKRRQIHMCATDTGSGWRPESLLGFKHVQGMCFSRKGKKCVFKLIYYEALYTNHCLRFVMCDA